MAAVRLVDGGVHLAPALTPDTLPPSLLFAPIIGTVSALDSISRAMTPPNLYLFRQLMGYMHTVEIYTAAELRVADALADAPGGSLRLPALTAAVVPECAAVADAASPAACPAVQLRLERVLRALAAYGVFAEDGAGGTWRNTAPSEFLRAAHPHSVRATALMFGGVQFRMMAFLPETVRTGRASFAGAFDGAEFWAWYRANPAEHDIFDTTMTQLGRLGGADAAIAADFPWAAAVDTLVDVGGGYGDMLAEILVRQPGLRRGVVFDQPEVIARAEASWAAVAAEAAAAASLQQAGGPAAARRAVLAAGRLTLAAGDMFDHATIPSAGGIRWLQQRLSAVRAASAAAAAGGAAAAEAKVCSFGPSAAELALGLLAAGSSGNLTTVPAAALSAGPVGYALRDIVHDWPDEDVVRILASIAKVMRRDAGGSSSAAGAAPSLAGAAPVCIAGDGSRVEFPAPADVPGARGDRLFLVDRVVRPGVGFVDSMGTNDADIVMLGAFGTTAGERTEAHFARLLAAAGLRVVRVAPTRSHYFVVEAAVA